MAIKAKGEITIVDLNDGATGPTGPAGTPGKGVQSVELQYAKNTSNITAPVQASTDWSITMPSYTNGYYLWVRTKVVYVNPASTTYSTPYLEKNWELTAQTYTQYQQLQDKFTWLVKSGTSESNMVLTDTIFSLVSKNIKLEGLVTANQNFKINLDGSMEAKNGTFTGNVSGSTITGSTMTLSQDENNFLQMNNDGFMSQGLIGNDLCKGSLYKGGISLYQRLLTSMSASCYSNFNPGSLSLVSAVGHNMHIDTNNSTEPFKINMPSVFTDDVNIDRAYLKIYNDSNTEVLFPSHNKYSGITGGDDGASSTNTNLNLHSWWGIGFRPNILSQIVPYGENSHWFDVRNGKTYCRGEYYAQSSKRVFHEGYLPTPDIIGSWQKHRGTVTDFNTALSEGGYHVANNSTGIPNAPFTGDIYGKLLVYVSTGDTHNNSNNWIWQVFYGTDGELYTRNKNNSSSWTAWHYGSFKENTFGSWWGGNVYVKKDGVCEVGKYMDFHVTNESTADLDIRLEARSDGMFFNNTIAPYGNQQLGLPSYRWYCAYLQTSPSVSSDRNVKRDINYLCHKDENHELNYEDMYAFVKDELELAEYKYKDGEEKKVGFIAQDLLYNNSYSDSKVGQFIVPPVAAPTEEEKIEIISNQSEGEEYKDPTLSYDMGNYINTLAGALKVAINEIETLKTELKELKQASGLL